MAVSASSGADIVGLNDFRRELRKLGGGWTKELRGVHTQISRRGAALSRGEALREGGVQAKAADALAGSANTREARIQVRPTKRNAMANVAFWGAKKRTGWFAAKRYHGLGARQHPRWVGNSWDVATRVGGPYAINPALARYLPELLDQYMKMIDNLAHKAFPER